MSSVEGHHIEDSTAQTAQHSMNRISGKAFGGATVAGGASSGAGGGSEAEVVLNWNKGKTIDLSALQEDRTQQGSVALRESRHGASSGRKINFTKLTGPPPAPAAATKTAPVPHRKTPSRTRPALANLPTNHSTNLSRGNVVEEKGAHQKFARAHLKLRPATSELTLASAKWLSEEKKKKRQSQEEMARRRELAKRLDNERRAKFLASHSPQPPPPPMDAPDLDQDHSTKENATPASGGDVIARPSFGAYHSHPRSHHNPAGDLPDWPHFSPTLPPPSPRPYVPRLSTVVVKSRGEQSNDGKKEVITVADETSSPSQLSLQFPSHQQQLRQQIEIPSPGVIIRVRKKDTEADCSDDDEGGEKGEDGLREAFHTTVTSCSGGDDDGYGDDFEQDEQGQMEEQNHNEEGDNHQADDTDDELSEKHSGGNNTSSACLEDEDSFEEKQQRRKEEAREYLEKQRSLFDRQQKKEKREAEAKKIAILDRLAALKQKSRDVVHSAKKTSHSTVPGRVQSSADLRREKGARALASGKESLLLQIARSDSEGILLSDVDGVQLMHGAEKNLEQAKSVDNFQNLVQGAMICHGSNEGNYCDYNEDDGREIEDNNTGRRDLDRVLEGARRGDPSGAVYSKQFKGGALRPTNSSLARSAAKANTALPPKRSSRHVTRGRTASLTRSNRSTALTSASKSKRRGGDTSRSAGVRQYKQHRQHMAKGQTGRNVDRRPAVVARGGSKPYRKKVEDTGERIEMSSNILDLLKDGRPEGHYTISLRDSSDELLGRSSCHYSYDDGRFGPEGSISGHSLPSLRGHTEVVTTTDVSSVKSSVLEEVDRMKHLLQAMSKDLDDQKNCRVGNKVHVSGIPSLESNEDDIFDLRLSLASKLYPLSHECAEDEDIQGDERAENESENCCLESVDSVDSGPPSPPADNELPQLLSCPDGVDNENDSNKSLDLPNLNLNLKPQVAMSDYSLNSMSSENNNVLHFEHNARPSETQPRNDVMSTSDDVLMDFQLKLLQDKKDILNKYSCPDSPVLTNKNMMVRESGGVDELVWGDSTYALRNVEGVDVLVKGMRGRENHDSFPSSRLHEEQLAVHVGTNPELLRRVGEALSSDILGYDLKKDSYAESESGLSLSSQSSEDDEHGIVSLFAREIIEQKELECEEDARQELAQRKGEFAAALASRYQQHPPPGSPSQLQQHSLPTSPLPSTTPSSEFDDRSISPRTYWDTLIAKSPLPHAAGSSSFGSLGGDDFATLREEIKSKEPRATPHIDETQTVSKSVLSENETSVKAVTEPEFDNVDLPRSPTSAEHRLTGAELRLLMMEELRKQEEIYRCSVELAEAEQVHTVQTAASAMRDVVTHAQDEAAALARHLQLVQMQQAYEVSLASATAETRLASQLELAQRDATVRELQSQLESQAVQNEQLGYLHQVVDNVALASQLLELNEAAGPPRSVPLATTAEPLSTTIPSVKKSSTTSYCRPTSSRPEEDEEDDDYSASFEGESRVHFPPDLVTGKSGQGGDVEVEDSYVEDSYADYSMSTSHIKGRSTDDIVGGEDSYAADYADESFAQSVASSVKTVPRRPQHASQQKQLRDSIGEVEEEDSYAADYADESFVQSVASSVKSAVPRRPQHAIQQKQLSDSIGEVEEEDSYAADYADESFAQSVASSVKSAVPRRPQHASQQKQLSDSIGEVEEEDSYVADYADESFVQSVASSVKSAVPRRPQHASQQKQLSDSIGDVEEEDSYAADYADESFVQSVASTFKQGVHRTMTDQVGEDDSYSSEYFDESLTQQSFTSGRKPPAGPRPRMTPPILSRKSGEDNYLIELDARLKGQHNAIDVRLHLEKTKKEHHLLLLKKQKFAPAALLFAEKEVESRYAETCAELESERWMMSAACYKERRAYEQLQRDLAGFSHHTIEVNHNAIPSSSSIKMPVVDFNEKNNISNAKDIGERVKGSTLVELSEVVDESFISASGGEINDAGDDSQSSYLQSNSHLYQDSCEDDAEIEDDVEYSSDVFEALSMHHGDDSIVETVGKPFSDKSGLVPTDEEIRRREEVVKAKREQAEKMLAAQQKELSRLRALARLEAEEREVAKLFEDANAFDAKLELRKHRQQIDSKVKVEVEEAAAASGFKKRQNPVATIPSPTRINVVHVPTHLEKDMKVATNFNRNRASTQSSIMSEEYEEDYSDEEVIEDDFSAGDDRRDKVASTAEVESSEEYENTYDEDEVVDDEVDVVEEVVDDDEQFESYLSDGKADTPIEITLAGDDLDVETEDDAYSNTFFEDDSHVEQHVNGGNKNTVSGIYQSDTLEFDTSAGTQGKCSPDDLGDSMGSGGLSSDTFLDLDESIDQRRKRIDTLKEKIAHIKKDKKKEKLLAKAAERERLRTEEEELAAFLAEEEEGYRLEKEKLLRDRLQNKHDIEVNNLINTLRTSPCSDVDGDMSALLKDEEALADDSFGSSRSTTHLPTGGREYSGHDNDDFHEKILSAEVQQKVCDMEATEMLQRVVRGFLGRLKAKSQRDLTERVRLEMKSLRVHGEVSKELRTTLVTEAVALEDSFTSTFSSTTSSNSSEANLETEHELQEMELTLKKMAGLAHQRDSLLSKMNEEDLVIDAERLDEGRNIAEIDENPSYIVDDDIQEKADERVEGDGNDILATSFETSQHIVSLSDNDEDVNMDLNSADKSDVDFDDDFDYNDNNSFENQEGEVIREDVSLSPVAQARKLDRFQSFDDSIENEIEDEVDEDISDDLSASSDRIILGQLGTEEEDELSAVNQDESQSFAQSQSQSFAHMMLQQQQQLEGEDSKGDTVVWGDTRGQHDGVQQVKEIDREQVELSFEVGDVVNTFQALDSTTSDDEVDEINFLDESKDKEIQDGTSNIINDDSYEDEYEDDEFDTPLDDDADKLSNLTQGPPNVKDILSSGVGSDSDEDEVIEEIVDDSAGEDYLNDSNMEQNEDVDADENDKERHGATVKSLGLDDQGSTDFSVANYVNFPNDNNIEDDAEEIEKNDISDTSSVIGEIQLGDQEVQSINLSNSVAPLSPELSEEQVLSKREEDEYQALEDSALFDESLEEIDAVDTSIEERGFDVIQQAQPSSTTKSEASPLKTAVIQLHGGDDERQFTSAITNSLLGRMMDSKEISNLLRDSMLPRHSIAEFNQADRNVELEDEDDEAIELSSVDEIEEVIEEDSVKEMDAAAEDESDTDGNVKIVYNAEETEKEDSTDEGEKYDDEEFYQIDQDDKETDSIGNEDVKADTVSAPPSSLLLTGDLPSLGGLQPLTGPGAHDDADYSDSDDSLGDIVEDDRGDSAKSKDTQQSLYDLLGDDDDDDLTEEIPRFGLPAQRRPSDSFVSVSDNQQADPDDPVSMQTLWQQKSNNYVSELLSHMKEHEHEQVHQGQEGVWSEVATSLDSKDFDTQDGVINEDIFFDMELARNPSFEDPDGLALDALQMNNKIVFDRINEILASLHRYRHRRATTPASLHRRILAQSLPLTPDAIATYIRRELANKPVGSHTGSQVLEDGTCSATLPNALDLVHVPVLQALQEAEDDEALRLTESITNDIWMRLVTDATASIQRAFQ